MVGGGKPGVTGKRPGQAIDDSGKQGRQAGEGYSHRMAVFFILAGFADEACFPLGAALMCCC
jgi:hypothetical protein